MAVGEPFRRSSIDSRVVFPASQKPEAIGLPRLPFHRLPEGSSRRTVYLKRQLGKWQASPQAEQNTGDAKGMNTKNCRGVMYSHISESLKYICLYVM